MELVAGGGSVVEHLIRYPKDTVTGDFFREGEVTQSTVSGQQCPGIGYSVSEGEAVG